MSSLQRSEVFSGVAGAKKIFGYLYEWLAYSDSDPGLEAIRELMRDHIVDTMSVDAGEEILGKVAERRRTHSLRSVSVQTGMHQVTAKKALIVAGIISHDDQRQDNQLVFPASSAETLLVRLAQGVSQLGLRRYLNLQRVQVALLAGSGHLKPILDTETMDALYHPDDLDAFFAELTRGSHLVLLPDLGQHSPMAAAKKANAGFLEIVDLLRNGELEWVGRLEGERGFPAILVRLEEVKLKVRLPPVEGIALSAVPDDFGIRYDGLRYIIGAGALAVETVINPVNRCPMKVIRPGEYARFKNEFVSLRDLARERKKAARWLNKELAEQGIFPVEAWRHNNAVVFRRSDFL